MQARWWKAKKPHDMFSHELLAVERQRPEIVGMVGVEVESAEVISTGHQFIRLSQWINLLIFYQFRSFFPISIMLKNRLLLRSQLVGFIFVSMTFSMSPFLLQRIDCLPARAGHCLAKTSKATNFSSLSASLPLIPVCYWQPSPLLTKIQVRICCALAW